MSRLHSSRRPEMQSKVAAPVSGTPVRHGCSLAYLHAALSPLHTSTLLPPPLTCISLNCPLTPVTEGTGEGRQGLVRQV